MTRIPITDAIKATLKLHRERTGCGVKALFSRTSDIPDDLSLHIVDNWLRGNSATIREDHAEFVIRAYKALPDNAKSLMAQRTEEGRKTRQGYIRITERRRSELIRLQKATNIFPTELLRNAPRCPQALKSTTVKGWLSGKIKSASEEHYEFALERWQKFGQQAQTPPPVRIPLTPKRREQLKRLREESGISAMKLMRGQKDAPKGVNSTMITNWLCGKVETADKCAFDYVVALWESSQNTIAISEHMTRQLNAEFARTGIGDVALIRILKPQYSQFTTQLLRTLRFGNRRAISETDWQTLITSLASLPDKGGALAQHQRAGKGEYISGTGFNPKRSKGAPNEYKTNFAEDYIPLTAEITAKIITQRDRTGIGAIALLRSFSADKPETLSANTISAWINGNTKNLSKSRLNWVLRKWSSLPDK